MVAVMTKHDIKWLSPSPVWDKIGDLTTEDSRKLFARPTILRFNKDNFMDEMLAVMSYYPDRLFEWIARPETWREPMPAPKTAARLSPVEPRSSFKKRQLRQLESYTKAKVGTGITGGVADTSIADLVEEKLLKLYQPAQQRFYLVTASLVCQKRGLPDRVVDSGSQEQVSFVIRRLVSREKNTKLEDYKLAGCDEYAFVQTDEGFKWRNIDQDEDYETDQLLPDEERLPMVSIGFDELGGRKRKLVAGFIPVAKREAYLGATNYELEEKNTATNNTTGQKAQMENAKREAIKALFEQDVAAPWKNMISHAATVRDGLVPSPGDVNPPESIYDKNKIEENANNNVQSVREQIQTTSWYVLLDLANFIKRYIPNIWDALFDPGLESELGDAESTLLKALKSVTINRSTYKNKNYFSSYSVEGSTYNLYIDSFIDGAAYNQNHFKLTLVDALVAIMGGKPYNDTNAASLADNLEGNELPYDRKGGDAFTAWPPFLFPLADPMKPDPLPNVTVTPTIDDEFDLSNAKINELTRLVGNAVTELEAEAPEMITFRKISNETSLDARDGVFVIRCIYERPNCGPFNPPVVSKPSRLFEMASFFDSDAPGRPIRIPMPLDISPAGLRKFNKNTTFMISDMLCGKIRNIRKVTFGDLVLSVLPWPFHKDLPTPSKTGPCGSPGNTFGMFCSLSIPIVTLCALILLIIMVTLFDIFFKWLPLLFTCFPLPGLKGKKS